ncbi:MAG: hypothetical protein FD123_219 [Bacteroidetes bacterium]|nr:MAG: hypothetical protein FD123_219 [Bacteroidota bacterium]
MLRLLSVALLLFNGIGAIYGGWSLMQDPSGGKLGLSLAFLEESPFYNYLIPGIILFCANGILSIIFAAAVISRYRYYPEAIFIQGAILTGWIFIQVMMIEIVYYLHFILGGTGIVLMILGFLLHRREKKQQIFVA